MLNMRNQLDKIIITAMDRFVWFVLLVVMSHLVTEFTRVTGYTRGPRQDVVMVNDSLIQPIRVQNLVLYPGQEYGLYEQQNQQYYNGNRPYTNYNNNNSNNNNNFLSSLFKQFINNNNNNNNHKNNDYNIDNNPSEQQQPPIETANNNLLNFIPTSNAQGDVRTFSFRPLIDSIFEIPISTLRAVNNLVGRLTGSYQQPASTQQPQQQQQPPPPRYSVSYPSYAQSAPSYYGMQRSADATQTPKTQFEMLNRLRQTTDKVAPSPSTAATPTSVVARKPMDLK